MLKIRERLKETFFLRILLIIFVVAFCIIVLNSRTILTIFVYYETRCSDSGVFFNEQLSRLNETLLKKILIILVPFGKASVIDIDFKKNYNNHFN